GHDSCRRAEQPRGCHHRSGCGQRRVCGMSGASREIVGEAAAARSQLEFDDNLLLPLLYGERDQHLDRIERQLGVSLVPRGNRLAIAGPASATEVARLILSRPAVEACERLGFLPGDLREKVDPYLRPIFDALNDMLPAEQIAKRLGNGEIEVAPIAFMRGRTLARAFVILDEAQNTTPVQMKMFLTRLGEGSRMVVTGDPSQVDLAPGARSGLADALEALRGLDNIGVVHFTEKDVVRHPLVARIVGAYEPRERAARGALPP